MMRLFVAVCAIFAVGVAFGKVGLGTPFSDGVVLQRDMKVPIWGTATSGEHVRVVFADQQRDAVVDEHGNWMAWLEPMSGSMESRPLSVISDSGEIRVVSDVLVGEVWLVAGHDDMSFRLWNKGEPRYRDANGGLVCTMDMLPQLRFCRTKACWSDYPRQVKAKWCKAEPNSNCHATVSAVAYYYGRELQLALGVPIGIVEADHGDSAIDAWTPASGYLGCGDSIADIGKLKPLPEKQWRQAVANGLYARHAIFGKSPKQQPTVLWNGMVDAWKPMAMRGVVCRQSRCNIEEAGVYEDKLHAFYNGWGTEFRNPKLKMHMVRLSPLRQDSFCICNAQDGFLSAQTNASATVVSDLCQLDRFGHGCAETMARRLAMSALKRDYGCDLEEADSPQVNNAISTNGVVALSFSHVRYWYVRSGKLAMEPAFEVADANGFWHAAKLQNRHDDRGCIWGRDLVLKAEKVDHPMGVRYVDCDRSFGTLYNQASLPLGAFEIRLSQHRFPLPSR